MSILISNFLLNPLLLFISTSHQTVQSKNSIKIIFRDKTLILFQQLEQLSLSTSYHKMFRGIPHQKICPRDDIADWSQTHHYMSIIPCEV